MANLLLSILFIFLISDNDLTTLPVQNGLAPGWMAARPDQNCYFEIQEVKGNHIAYLRAREGQEGGLGQRFKPELFGGKRMRVSARFRIKDVEKFFGLYARVDSKFEGIYFAFDNMRGRSLLGTLDWVRKSIILEVPEDAYSISIGAYLQGSGEAWIDDFIVEEVDRSLGVTDQRAGGTVRVPENAQKRAPNSDLPDQPRNLDFEVGF